MVLYGNYDISWIPSGKSLDSVLFMRPQWIFPEEIVAIDGSYGIDNIIGALNIYNLVRMWLDDNRPIFCPRDMPEYDEERSSHCDHNPENSNVIRFMQQTYVPGYGETSIYQLTQFPMLTGRMLLFNSWDYYTDGGIASADIYGALAVVAELVASYKDNPYDVTCMQLPEHELLRLGIGRKTSDCGDACRDFVNNIDASRLEKHIFATNIKNSFTVGEFSTLCNLRCDQAYIENAAESTLEQQSSSIVPLPSWLLDENVSEYIPKGDYYVWLVNKASYRMDGRGVVYEERLL